MQVIVARAWSYLQAKPDVCSHQLQHVSATHVDDSFIKEQLLPGIGGTGAWACGLELSGTELAEKRMDKMKRSLRSAMADMHEISLLN